MQKRLPCRHCGTSVVLPIFRVRNLIQRRDLPLCSICWMVRDSLKEPTHEVMDDIMLDWETITHAHVPAGEVIDLILNPDGADFKATPANQPRAKQQTQQLRQTVGVMT